MVQRSLRLGLALLLLGDDLRLPLGRKRLLLLALLILGILLDDRSDQVRSLVDLFHILVV